jgi:hypothetical protein
LKALLERARQRISRWTRRELPEPTAKGVLFADHDEIQDIALQMTRTKVELERFVPTLRSGVVISVGN